MAKLTTSAETSDPMVTTAWLAEQLDNPAIRIIDASWRLPGTDARPAHQAFLERHIPGAVFFDIDAVTDKTSLLPHMAPDEETFAAAMSEFGISNDDHIIIYDDAGIFSAPRVWWTCRAMGHKCVSVLDGGLPKWQAENRPVTSGIKQFTTSAYKACVLEGSFCTASDVRKALTQSSPVLDARPAARFAGTAPEPRPDLRSGHMPGAVNIPFADVLTPDGTLKDPSALAPLFLSCGVSATTPALTSCGSGITAAILNLAMERLGLPQKGLYDGAWAEWGHPDNDLKAFPVTPERTHR